MIVEPWDQERILLFGQEGTGKTKAVWSIASAIHKDKSPGHFYYLDIDHTTSRFARRNPEVATETMTRALYSDWSDLLTQTKRWNVKATVNDWLVLDGAGETWLESQGEYWRVSEGQTLSQAATDDKGTGGYGGAHGKNWDRINKIYRDFSTQIVRWPGHVIACTAADKLGDQVDPVYNRYSSFGWRPSGQKYLGHHFHTVIFMQEVGSGYKMTTVKDRERDKLKMVSVGEFANDYLVKVAGWTR